jgi:ABC-type multidrug transport system ATPase subunit
LSPDAAALEFRDVSYRIGGNLILDHLSFRIEPGRTLVLLGRSGSGKTTALKILPRRAKYSSKIASPPIGISSNYGVASVT